MNRTGRTFLGLLLGTSLTTLLSLGACKGNDDRIPTEPLTAVAGHESVAQDNSHKESPRLPPAESYMRTYLQLFGGLSPLQAQVQLSAGGSGLFDSWTAYLGALGLPNYIIDLPRQGQTNALMMATFERLGLALCDKAVEKDLKGSPATPVEKRLIFAFELAKDPLDQAGFATRFDILHRTFLSYPAAMAPTDRTARFFALYKDIVAKHDPKGSRFLATEAAWAAVCSGLLRHPEFHLN